MTHPQTMPQVNDAPVAQLLQEIQELQQRNEILDEKWQEVKEDPFNLHNMFALLGKLTMCIVHLNNARMADVQAIIDRHVPPEDVSVSQIAEDEQANGPRD